jgi:hypothetical protein
MVQYQDIFQKYFFKNIVVANPTIGIIIILQHIIATTTRVPNNRD